MFVVAPLDEDFLEVLLGAGFDGSYVTEGGETPLHAAVKADKPKSVLLLLNCDSCDPNAADGHKQTALHRAGEFGYVNCLEFLVSHNRVDIDAEDAWKRTALHWLVQKYVFCTRLKFSPLASHSLIFYLLFLPIEVYSIWPQRCSSANANWSRP